jgi:hypothetical protein
MPACKGCQQPIQWGRKGKKFRPLNVDGSRHRCDSYRKRKPITGPLTKQGPMILGRDFRPSCGRCDVPPWEVCACSFDWAKAGLASPPNSAADRANAEADHRFQHMLDLADA